MRTEIIEKTVYTLDEVKDAAIAANWDINIDHDWWDCVYDDAKTIFEMIGFNFAAEEQPFFFSGFSSQGAGACINKAYYQYKKGALKAIKAYVPADAGLHKIVKELQNLRKKTFYTITASIRHSGRYYHERSMAIDAECEKGIFDASDFDDVVADLCHWLYRQLEKEYDYLTSAEAIEETLRANEYGFNENGEIV